MGLSPQWLLTPTSGRGTFSQLFRSWRKSFACILPQDRGHEPCNPLNPRAKLHANQPRIKVVDYTATDVCRVSCGLPAGVHALTVAVPPGGGTVACTTLLPCRAAQSPAILHSRCCHPRGAISTSECGDKLQLPPEGYLHLATC